MNLWQTISPGAKAPSVVNAILEISKGSRVKYEIDKETGMLALDRILYSPFVYPANYGFIPRTYCDDGDPLDILVLCQEVLLPNTLVESRVIGVMNMIDGGEMDDKIIAVAKSDSSLFHLNDLKDLPPNLTEEFRHFFEEYKKLEKKKKVEIKAFHGKAEAEKIVLQAIADYNKKFGN